MKVTIYVVLLSLLLVNCQGNSAFLSQVPLRIVSFTPGPETLSQNDVTELSGRTPITVTFNRAVIPLGGDWKDEDGYSAEKVFQFDKGFTNIPGKFRWVTTFIARFDPDIDWPTDLSFSVSVKPSLQTFDSVKLQDESAQMSRSYRTQSLSMYINNVESPRTMELTEGHWNPFAYAKLSNGVEVNTNIYDQNSRIGEVPPDGVIEVTFSNDVNLELISPALRLTRHNKLAYRTVATSSSQRETSTKVENTVVPQDSVVQDSNVESTVQMDDAVSDVDIRPIDDTKEIINDDTTSIPIKITSCTSSSDSKVTRCIKITPQQTLAVDTFYYLVLPVGARYNTYSGLLSNQQIITVCGLFSFIFPVQITALPQSDRYNLWVRHGLKTMSNALPQVTVEPRVDDAKLTPISKSMVQLSGSFQPGKTYRISIARNNDWLDGWDLSYLGNTIELSTGDAPTFITDARGDAIFERGFDLSWTFLTQNIKSPDCNIASTLTRSPAKIVGTPVTMENINQVLASKVSYGSTFITDREQQTIQIEPTTTLRMYDLDSVTLLKKSGIFLKEQFNYMKTFGTSNCFVQKTSDFVASTDMGLTIMSTMQRQMLTVWVTSMTSNRDIPNAAVYLYSVPWNASPDTVSVISRTTTDNNGVAVLDNQKRGYSQLFVVVEKDGKIAIASVPNYSSYGVSEYEPTTGAIITDRKIYKEGDSIYVKGYIRQLIGTSMTFTKELAANTFYLHVTWKEADYSQSTSPVVGVVPVTVDPEFGSFEGKIHVPADVTYGTKMITLFSAAPNINKESMIHQTGTSISFASILLSDPRIPTAELDVSTNSRVFRPQSPLNLQIQVKTYTGIPIENTKVKLQWWLTRGNFAIQRNAYSTSNDYWYQLLWESNDGVSGTNWITDPLSPVESKAVTLYSYENEQGEMEIDIPIGSNGQVNFPFFPQVKQKLLEGDSIRIELSWTDPTRALLKKELNLQVAHSEWMLSVNPTAQQPIPTHPFSLYMNLKDRSTGIPIYGKSAIARLYEWDSVTPITPDPKTGSLIIPDKFKLIDTCTDIKTDGGVKPWCRFQLPKTGRYLIIAEVKDNDGFTIVTALPTGKTDQEWKQDPLRSFEAISMVPDKTVYQVGDNAAFYFNNPFPSARAMIIWGNKITKQRRFIDLSSGEQKLVIPLGNECVGSCVVSIAIVAPRREVAITVVLPVPISPLFDLQSPCTLTSTYTIAVVEKPADTSLLLEMKSSKEIAAPGDEINVRVALKNLDGRTATGEVAFFVVDKSILDLVPYPLVDVQSQFGISLTEPITTVFDSRSRPSIRYDSNLFALKTGYASSKEILIRRIKNNPWTQPQWNLRPSSWSPSQVEIDDETYFNSLASWITPYPWGTINPFYRTKGGNNYLNKGDTMNAPPMAEAMESAASADDSSTTSNSNTNNNNNNAAPQVRSNFQMTPFFAGSVSTDKDGVAYVKIKLPDNLSTYIIRAYAVSRIDQTNNRPRFLYGSSEIEQIARKKVNLQLSVPRITRVGDVFFAGVSVAAFLPRDTKMISSEIIKISATVNCDGSIIGLVYPPRAETATSQSPTIDLIVEYNEQGVSSPQEVLFGFVANGYGTATIQFDAYSIPNRAQGSATDKYTWEDSVIADIPVLGIQDYVSIATSMVLSTSITDWKEGIHLPRDVVPNSGSLSLTAGVGNLPSIIEFSRNILDQTKKNRYSEPTGLDWVGALVPYPILSLYLPQDPTSDTPISEMQQLALKKYQQAIEELRSYTTDANGLSWSPRFQYKYTDPYLNVFALYVASRLKPFNMIKGVPNDLTSKWKSALNNYLIRRASEERWLGREFGDHELLAFTFLALGSSWKPSFEGLSTQDQDLIYRDLSFTKLEDKIKDLSTTAQCAIALTYLYEKNNNKRDTLSYVATRLENLIRIQGRTAYISFTSGNPNADQMATILGLQVLSLMGPRDTNQIVAKLTGYVAQNEREVSYFRWMGIQQLVHSIFSLSTYDTLNGNVAPELKIKVSSGTNSLLAASFTSANSSPITQVTPFSKLDIPPRPIEFYVDGKGEASVVAGMTFIPSDVPDTPIYRGIYVEKIVQRVNTLTGRAEGAPITNAIPGDIVQVTIQISTPDDLTNVRVIDSVPSALEPQDENIDDSQDIDVISSSDGGNSGSFSGGIPFDTTARTRKAMAVDYISPIRCWWCPVSVFDRETRVDRVIFHGRHIYAGTHTVSYKALVVTSGKFTLPPTKAYVLSQPEVMGLSAGGIFTSVEKIFDVPDQIAQSCTIDFPPPPFDDIPDVEDPIEEEEIEDEGKNDAVADDLGSQEIQPHLSHKDKNNDSAIAGGVSAAVIIVAAIAIVSFIFIWKKINLRRSYQNHFSDIKDAPIQPNDMYREDNDE